MKIRSGQSNKFQLVDMFPITDKSQKSVDMFLTNRQNVDMFLAAILRTGRSHWTSSRLLAQVWISCFFSSCHVETVSLLTHSWRSRPRKAWKQSWSRAAQPRRRSRRRSEYPLPMWIASSKAGNKSWIKPSWRWWTSSAMMWSSHIRKRQPTEAAENR